MQCKEPRKIDIAAIHDVNGAGLCEQQIENIHVVHLAVRDMDERGYIAA